VGVYAATGPHDHHLRDRCVDPQIQIRKQLLRLATTSPPTPDALDGGFAPELFPSTRRWAARHPGLSGATTERR
jgi:hypothetical protein